MGKRVAARVPASSDGLTPEEARVFQPIASLRPAGRALDLTRALRELEVMRYRSKQVEMFRARQDYIPVSELRELAQVTTRCCELVADLYRERLEELEARRG